MGYAEWLFCPPPTGYPPCCATLLEYCCACCDCCVQPCACACCCWTAPANPYGFGGGGGGWSCCCGGYACRKPSASKARIPFLKQSHLLAPGHCAICAGVVPARDMLLWCLVPLLTRSLVLGWRGPLALRLGSGGVVSCMTYVNTALLVVPGAMVEHIPPYDGGWGAACCCCCCPAKLAALPGLW
jgi:hypothetical protein